VKRIVRKFAVWLEWKTSKWILPTEVWSAIESGKPEAVIAVKQAETFWGEQEPEILKARARISQVAYFANEQANPCRVSDSERRIK
jgi:hypothetical protein